MNSQRWTRLCREADRACACAAFTRVVKPHQENESEKVRLLTPSSRTPHPGCHKLHFAMLVFKMPTNRQGMG